MSRWDDVPGPRWATRLALVLTAAVALVLVTASSGRPALASVPSDQVMVPVGGSPLGGITTNPAMSPQFSSATHDYVIYCGTGLNVVTLHLTGANGGTIQAGGQSGASLTLTVNVGEGQAAVVGGSVSQYWIRCLPHDFPVLQINRPAAPAPGYYLTGNILSSSDGRSGLYAMILDSNGTPVWYQAAPGAAINVTLLPGNNLAWIPAVGPGLGANPNGAFRLYQLDNQTTSSVRTAPAPPAPTDPHELLQLSNGHRMIFGSPLKSGVNLSAFPALAAANNTIVDCWIEELDAQGGLAWLWKASDHLNVNESTRPTLVSYNNQTVADVYHCNSLDVQSAAGPVLLSVRHTDAVYLLNKGTGATIWKMGGNGHREAGAQALTIVGDPLGGFFAQHDARFQGTTDVSLYDDHSGQSTGKARGIQYAIDTSGAGTATLDFSYGTVPIASATGSFRRYAGGTDNLVGWGLRAGSGFDEVNAAGGLLMSMRFPNGEAEYRVVKVDATALDINLLRSTAGLPRPVAPSTSWQSLGGALTSRPAAASWSPDRLDAFVRGSDQQTWHIFSLNGQWSGWEPLGGTLTSGPGVASWSSGRLDVFVRGSDQQLWHRWFDGGQWSGWEPLGGVLSSSPSVASWSAGRLDVMVQGTDQQVWHRWFDGSQWN
ncbi:MAG: aryl-sulfate sulfotransferase, partial [Candidatus Dormibacteraeota bacterium]|nr:aryl-sulfate sulfotransferase [Candidatus Dormibacteraeota bacterium]